VSKPYAYAIDFGAYLYRLAVALALGILVTLWVERVFVGGLYKAKNGPIRPGKSWSLAAIAIASAFVIASPVAAWLSGDW
jgi:hypothetical protein